MRAVSTAAKRYCVEIDCSNGKRWCLRAARGCSSIPRAAVVFREMYWRLEPLKSRAGLRDASRLPSPLSSLILNLVLDFSICFSRFFCFFGFSRFSRFSREWRAEHCFLLHNTYPNKHGRMLVLVPGKRAGLQLLYNVYESLADGNLSNNDFLLSLRPGTTASRSLHRARSLARLPFTPT